MDRNIQFIFIVTILIYLGIIVHLLKNKKLNLKYTLLWILSGIILLIITLFPGMMFAISNIMSIKTPINSAFILAGMFVIIILITMTSIVSELNGKIRNLIQEVAILEKKIREIEKDNN